MLTGYDVVLYLLFQLELLPCVLDFQPLSVLNVLSILWYLRPPAPAPVPLLLSWDLVERFQTWELTWVFFFTMQCWCAPKVFIFVHSGLYRCWFYLQLFGTCSCGETGLVEVYSLLLNCLDIVMISGAERPLVLISSHMCPPKSPLMMTMSQTEASESHYTNLWKLFKETVSLVCDD